MKVLSVGKYDAALIDDDDYDRASKITWWYDKHSGYIFGLLPHNKKVRLHRFITGTTDVSIEVDHKNGNRRDNRKCNLRECTRKQNLANRCVKRTSKTGYKGVSYKPKWSKSKPYWARIKIDGKYKSLGTFKTPQEAHAAYLEVARSHYGEFVPDPSRAIRAT